MVQPEYAPLLVKVKVARPAVVALDDATTTLPPPAPVHVFGSGVAVIALVALVTRRPFTSCTSTVTVVVLVAAAPAECGESLLETASLFGAPTICVVNVAELPAIELLLVVVCSRHAPGVDVDVKVKRTRPLTAVAVPLPAENVAPLPAVLAVMVQMFAAVESRVTVMTVELSAMLRLPAESLMLTVRTEVETKSAAIGFGEKADVVTTDVPGALLATMTLQPVRVPDDAETWMLPAVVVVVAVVVATPFVAEVAPDGEIVAVAGVSRAKVTTPFELLTVLPLASLNVAVMMTVFAPFAIVEVGLAAQVRLLAGPKTETGAVPVSPPAVATTLHGWVAEFVAVAAKRPAEVIAPQPPVTDQLTVEPDGEPLAVNCWVPPTGIEAEAGEIVRPPVAEGVVLTWK
jgi:hypothetical protein